MSITSQLAQDYGWGQQSCTQTSIDRANQNQQVLEQEQQRVENGEVTRGRDGASWSPEDSQVDGIKEVDCDWESKAPSVEWLEMYQIALEKHGILISPKQESKAPIEILLDQMRSNDAPTSDAAAKSTDSITGKKVIKGTWEAPRGTDDALTFSFNNKTFETDYAVRLRARKKWSKASLFDDANQNGKFNNGETLWGSFKASSKILSRTEGKNPIDRALLNTDSGKLKLFYENDLLAKGSLTRTALAIILAEI